MADAVSRKSKISKRKFLCGTPDAYCSGTWTKMNHYMKNHKTHSTTDEAFECYSAYLVKQGYKKVGSREFASPNDGPILVLTKKVRFGARLRGGKEGRSMPYHFNSGAIVSM